MERGLRGCGEAVSYGTALASLAFNGMVPYTTAGPFVYCQVVKYDV